MYLLRNFEVRQGITVVSVIAIIVLLVAVAGCITVNISTPTVNTSTTMATPSVVPAPISTETPAAINQTDQISPLGENRTISLPYSKSDINRRFIEAVFGNEALYLNRWNGNFVKVGIAGNYTREDVNTLNTFIARFNNMSSSTRLTNVYEEENEELTIRLVPSSYFDAMPEEKVNKVYRDTDTGEILFVDQTFNNSYVVSDEVFVDSRFTGEERKYLILRGLLYDLGFEGYTGDTDSIFYYDARSSNISTEDWAVIGLMYSRKFDYGDSMYSAMSKLV